MAIKQPTLFIFKVLEGGGCGSTGLRETVNENYFHRFIYADEIILKKQV